MSQGGRLELGWTLRRFHRVRSSCFNCGYRMTDSTPCCNLLGSLDL
jgi:hypothetical protein